MLGNFADKIEVKNENRIGRWFKPWFYKHVESKFEGKNLVEFIPLRDYNHRHTKSIFWELE